MSDATSQATRDMAATVTAAALRPPWRARLQSLDAAADELREAVGADEWFAIPLATRLRIVRHVSGVDAPVTEER